MLHRTIKMWKTLINLSSKLTTWSEKSKDPWSLPPCEALATKYSTAHSRVIKYSTADSKFTKYLSVDS